MVSFKVSNKVPEVVHGSSPRYDHYIHHLAEYTKEGCTRVLQSTPWSPDTFRPSHNGFVLGVIEAYNGHHNLIIRPDDVWLAIAAQFGLFVTGNAESLRRLFVDHKGKKELVFSCAGSLDSASYARLATEASAQLKSSLKDERLCDWILPAFSTTTKNDVIVGSVLLMATMKHYFELRFEFCCGIPSVTLEGTTEDWVEIHRRVGELPGYGPECEKWSGLLGTITAQFVESSKGNVDRVFWSKICHHLGWGSGPRYISGWISAFCVFDKRGCWQLDFCGPSADELRIWQFRKPEHASSSPEYPRVNVKLIPNGYLSVNVRVNDNGVEHETVMFAGHLGYEIVGDLKNGVAPRVTWAIALRDEELAAKAKAKERAEAEQFYGVGKRGIA